MEEDEGQGEQVLRFSILNKPYFFKRRNGTMNIKNGFILISFSKDSNNDWF